MEFDYEKLVSATDGFSPSRLIGKGSHGYVYKALLHEEDNKPHKLVAIKTPSLSSQSQPSLATTKTEQMKKLEDEINVMSSLPYNPHVLTFLGHAEKKLMVIEFMPNGSLHQLLHVSSSSSPPTWLKRIEIAVKIARAVNFLHEQGILHRDIKSDNILFDSNWEPKLADFGLAVDLVDKKVPAPAGTIGYLDPCYTSPENLSVKTDVYSYGVVLLEIVSCRKAIDVSRSPSSIVDWAVPLIEEGKIGEIFSGGGGGGGSGVFMETNLRLLRMAARCVSSDVESRPCSGEITAEMVACLTEPVRSLPLWISFFRGVVKLKRRRKRLRERLTWPGQTCRVR
ncbi:unnamed protein product [Eruca vesicaria subsp. sativa]|uniref:Protein kinase domain-containing protein n=1 Tax=Eruca vesicaria subsp. sativa TaxID=29727 RepID=A0ABC8KB38_ERUVS|nr:unnamed protein product [Eruca vesicaria subsp. sativa]